MDELTQIIWWANQRQAGIQFLLDFDGTLSPLVDDPESSMLNLSTQSLVTLSSLGDVIIISERPKGFLERLFAVLPVSIAAEHGAFFKSVGSLSWEEVFHTSPEIKITYLRAELREVGKGLGSVLIEEKEQSTTFHFRQIRHSQSESSWRELEHRFQLLAEKYGVKLLPGKDVFEFRMSGTGKGHFIHWLHNRMPAELLIAAGDDLTDEEMFAATAALGGECIKVGEGATTARFRANSPAQLIEFLASLQS
jgi:trehalose 6-phosphate synthase/phosphatase